MKCLLAALLALTAVHVVGEGLLEDLIFFDIALGDQIEMGPITAETVQGYEILYATPGAGDISEIAGHLLLRVKLDNNPKAAALGIENPNDLVISFLANTQAGKPPPAPQPVVIQETCEQTNWLNLVQNKSDQPPLEGIWQSLLGLTGGFPITMDRQTLAHAIKSYTIEQDRDLVRYQLNLTEEQEADLLAHLCAVRLGAKPSYYFFSQNCGSVLVQVVGEGIGDERIATFSPLVSPPHTLLGNLIRRGLAHRISPAFHSYRKQGFIATDLFAERLGRLRARHPQLHWPSLADLNDPNDEVRTAALMMLAHIVRSHPDLHIDIYELAVLAQEKDMVYADKGLACEAYTSEFTAEARELQRLILQVAPDHNDLKVDVDQRLDDHFLPREVAFAQAGTKHTEHYRLALGTSIIQADGQADRAVLSLEGALLHQDLGSRSQIAMQRSSAATLGAISLHVDDGEIGDWHLTGLKLRKFRDTLNGVPSAFTSTRGLGLGLTVLDIHHSAQSGSTRTDVAGIEGLANILSSPNYNDFLLLSLGADITYQDRVEVAVPIGFEHLWSLDDAMNWQWRNKATYDTIRGERYSASSSLVIRLGEVRECDVLLRLSVEYARDRDDHETIDTLTVGSYLELNRW